MKRYRPSASLSVRPAPVKFGSSGASRSFHLVRIPSRGIRLPHFDQRVRHRAIILIEDATCHDDALAERRGRVLRGQIVIGGRDRFMTVHRRRQFGEGLRNDDQRLFWVTEFRRPVPGESGSG